MKHFITFALGLMCVAASAATSPTLFASPYPADVVQPKAAVFTVNGGPPKPCALVQVTGGLQPQCDLSSITLPGAYVLVMTVTSDAQCVNKPNEANCFGAGSASSAPFTFKWLGNGPSVPVLSVQF